MQQPTLICRGLDSKTKILITDDETHSLYAMEKLLSMEPYEILFANNGQGAIDQVKQNKPDVVLLDVMMPEMTGYEVCQYLKNNEDTRHIPIILISALDQEEHMIYGLNVGADEFISKPVSGPELRARIRSMLRIKKQYDEILDLLQLREEMADMIVHDMRSPISALLLYTDLIERKAGHLLSNDHLTRKVRLQAHRLNSYLGDLLLLAKMKSGKLNLRPSQVDPSKLLHTIVDQFQELAGPKEITLEIFEPNEVREISVDIKLIERVLDNLLSNALKFSPNNGSITLHLTYPNTELDSLNQPELRIQVIDQGPGIPVEYRERIFNKYEVIEISQAAIPQIGLGLALCKIVMEAHGGKIFVQDNETNGSIFTIEL